ncbi:MAG: SH3 domain-containing protein [bacterium]|nr:SH3 domain-containing protein [bacterium]
MSDFEYTSTWETVNTGIQEVERLVSQGQYNASMLRARKTLDYMVHTLADKACIPQSDLAQMIDDLYNGNWITKETREHFHTIRNLGNTAANGNNNNATDANVCYHILAQEAHVFSRQSPRKRPSSTTNNRTSVARKYKRRKNGRDLLIAYALRVLVPLVALILIIFIATKLVNAFSNNDKPTEPVITTSEALTIPAEPDTSLPTEESTTAADSSTVMYRAITTVNVRPEPSTSTERIGKLSTNDTVEFLREYDDTWVVVRYNGQEAYVARQYLVPVE